MENSTTEELRTNAYFTECCRQCGSDDSTRFSAKYLAIAACLAFVAGIALVLFILFVIRLKRDKKLCFKQKEEPFKGKWEGASQKATIQVLKKHTLDRSEETDKFSTDDKPEQEANFVSERQVLDVESAEPNEETETQATAEETSQQRECVVEVTEAVANDQKQDTNITQLNVSSEKDHNLKDEIETETRSSDNSIDSSKLAPAESSIRSSHLYETSRDSSVYEREDLVLQNANFRLSALSNI